MPEDSNFSIRRPMHNSEAYSASSVSLKSDWSRDEVINFNECRYSVRAVWLNHFNGWTDTGDDDLVQPSYRATSLNDLYGWTDKGDDDLVQSSDPLDFLEKIVGADDDDSVWSDNSDTLKKEGSCPTSVFIKSDGSKKPMNVEKGLSRLKSRLRTLLNRGGSRGRHRDVN